MSKMIKWLMEGMSEIPQRELENVATTEKRIELMKPFFSENTEINSESDNVYRINTTLDKGNFCEGGQKVEIVFQVEEESFKPTKKLVKREYPEYGLDTFEPVDYFRTIDPYISGVISSLIINGQEMVNPNIKVLLDSRDSGKGGSHFSNGKDQIRNKKFDNGDDIAAYFHELGHLKRDKNDLSSKQLEKNDRHIRWLEESVGYGYKTTLSDFLVYKKRIYEERQASRKAIKMMNGTNLFPNDQTLLESKALFANNLSTYIYVYKNRFDNLAERLKKDIPKILNFDQDWHY